MSRARGHARAGQGRRLHSLVSQPRLIASVNESLLCSFSRGQPDHLRRIGYVVVLDDLASRIELPEVTVVGERVPLTLIRRLERNEHEDLCTAVEDRVWFKPCDLEWCQRLEEPCDIRLAAAFLKPRHVGHGDCCFPLDGVVQLVEDRRDIATSEGLVDCLHGFYIAHSALHWSRGSDSRPHVFLGFPREDRGSSTI